MRVYGDKKSGNCLKVLYIAEHLGLPYEWVDVDILKGESRTEDYLARNPAGQVPYVELDTGRALSQSNAILLYLARDSALLPDDPWSLAKVHQWLFWEQYSHEPTIAVCRFQMFYLGKSVAELDEEKIRKGNEALDLMEAHLAESSWIVDDSLSVADIALVAYTRLAHEGGFSLKDRVSVQTWLTRVEDALGLATLDRTL